MPRLIKNRQIVEDNWLLLEEADSDKLQELAASDLIIPLQSWLDWQQASQIDSQQADQQDSQQADQEENQQGDQPDSQQKFREALAERSGRIAVWLDSNELPAQLGESLYYLDMIALNFPVFRDGRPFSSARELRQNLNFKGDIRAVGDVLRDQLFYMQRCGFTEFTMREDQNLEQALSAFEDFHEAYQSSVDRPLPLFRRRV